jgi:hypothetical protein
MKTDIFHCYLTIAHPVQWSANETLFFSLCRYGSDLVSVESFRQNNFTAELAAEFLSAEASSPAGSSYWLGLKSYNDLQTNTLEADDGHQVG